MRTCIKPWWILAISLLSVCALAQEASDTGAFVPAQGAADVIRDFAGADGAFLDAGLIMSTFQKDDLASLLSHPRETDQVVVVALTGAQIRQAFERSVSLYPQPNASFLQISGFEVQFNKNAAPGQRIMSITANGSKIDEGRTYQIAMPSTLGRGGQGYFKIWDKAKIVKTLNTTVEAVLKGKHYSETSPRWSALG